MSEILKIAKAVDATARIHEESFGHEAADKEKGNKFVDFSTFYNLTLLESADLACKEAEIDKRYAQFIYLSLSGWWNDVLDWSNEIVNKGE